MNPLKTFAPDLNPLTPGILLEANGVYPSENGIAAMPVPEPVMDALDSDCLGVISFRTLGGSVRTIAGTTTKLYESGVHDWIDVTRESFDYVGSNNYRWHFAPWGNYILAVNGSDKFQVSITSKFDDVGVDLPIAKYITVSNNFVIMANFEDYESSEYAHRVAWSAHGDYTDWTASLSTESGYYDLTDTPGEITGIAKLGNGIAVFKESALYVGTYVGPPYIWSFERIQGVSGTVSQDAVIELENGLFYFGIDDFYWFDGSQPKRIGGPLNDWFQTVVDRQYWGNMLGAYDPFLKLVFWYYPTVADGSTKCVDSLIYDWQRNNWGHNAIDIQAALVHYAANMTYDMIPTYFADYQAIESSGLTYNDPFWNSYSFQTGMVNTSNELCRYTGTPSNVTFTTGDVGSNAGLQRHDSFMPYFRVYPTSMSVTPITRQYMNQNTFTTWPASTLTDEKADIRCSGRFARFSCEVDGEFELTGFDLISKPMARR